MSDTDVELLFVGDLMLSAPDPARYFAPARDILAAGDVTIGHLEWPHTDRGQVCVVDIPAPANPPHHLDALAECGFDVMTLAGNHMFDQGMHGVLDSAAGLRERGIVPVGAGANIAEARAPAIVEHGGLTLGFLSYNAVGPRESWATTVKAGVAPLRVHNHYELDIASPGSTPSEHTSLDQESEATMREDIRRLRTEVDIVCVCFHKGMGFVRARLAQYERPLVRAAIDAGADVIIGHHAHILRGVEVYRGKPVFHGVNHFVPAYTEQTDPLNPKSPRPRPKHLPSVDFFVPDPGSAPFPFPRESRHTMIARVVVDARGVREAGFVPCYLGDDARPIPHGADEVGRATVDYVAQISAEAELDVRLRWKDGRACFLDRDVAANDS